MNFSIKELEKLSKSDQRRILGGWGSYCSGGCCSPFADGYQAFYDRCLSGGGSGGGNPGGGGGGGGYPY